MTEEEWLTRHFVFGFECAVQSWKSVPESSRQDVTEALQAGFAAGHNALVSYNQLAKTKAKEWLERRL